VYSTLGLAAPSQGQKHCEGPKTTTGASVLVRPHFDRAELRDLSRVSRGTFLADLGVAQGRSGSRPGGRELGDVLCGLVARRQEGHGLPQATLLRAEEEITGLRSNVKLSQGRIGSEGEIMRDRP